ncbi:extracellular solute-binding protein [Actinospica sp. MGRD01-02]|uniref:Extracellular solute-binding protein n=1 Tax=Actinospica acidithermotolerans TaxID=2828514 RepID=A0A941EF98_9ACTN|nr:ABC transporter substrate-binding protein [Actinospica acidithermotolerans]MBR7830386.1 extracellular solute-binding protein [Actinospica acidithermotolerans]
MHRIAKIACTAAAVTLAATACSSSSSSTSGSGSSVNWSTVTSAASGGGMDALVAAAKKEGSLNVITLPRTWANYGTIMDDFTKKYGIKITDTNPNGSSGDEINAIEKEKGLSSAPDVVDVGNSHALPNTNLFAGYEVSTWSDIPTALKDANGKWYGDYGGYISIGCVAAKVAPAPCPKTFADLLNSSYTADYKGKVAMSGDPTSANAAFSAVWAAALASGGSLDDIKPGITFFSKLKSNGEYNAVVDTESTIEAGSTPITIDWEFNNSQFASDLKAKGIDMTVSIPTDGLYSAYYDQAVSKYAPHPAAARLWEEYLYSTVGQNDFMGGYARPVEFAAMQSAGTLDATDEKNLPTVSGTVNYPTESQLTSAQNTITTSWASSLG